MDASTARALGVVLRMELPAAFEDALREMERARMAAADLESRSQGLVTAALYALNTLDRLELPATGEVQRVDSQVLGVRSMVIAGLQSAGLDHIVAMAEEAETDDDI